ncbi:SH3 domain-containing protein [Labilibacter marinus]|uniref:SH3 domain-containing protein n=1 Tax=Labilibacter marinus TaxID=1477105 RepID=UPI0018E97DF9|nr:SH3 domain-containing protein [Labilibacter marinus]
MTILKAFTLWLFGLLAIINGFFYLIEDTSNEIRGLALVFILMGIYTVPWVRKRLRFNIKPPIHIFIYVCIMFIIQELDSVNRTSVEIVSSVNATTLNVREGAGTDYPVVFILEKGDTVKVVSAQEGWSEISLENRSNGFVASKYIQTKKNTKTVWWRWIVYITGAVFLLRKLFIRKRSYSSDTFSNFDYASDASNKVDDQSSINNQDTDFGNHHHSTNVNSKSSSRSYSTSQKEKIVDNESTVEKEVVFYCKFCGKNDSSISSLTSSSCRYSSNGKHQPYEGKDSLKFCCKYCGKEDATISSLTSGACRNNSSGKHKPYIGESNHIFFCKYCGKKDSTISSLTSSSCRYSPNRKHQPYEGKGETEFFCEYCGKKDATISSLTSGSCRVNPEGQHQPYIGEIAKEYYCKYCGKSDSTISSLTSSTCRISPLGKHQPYGGKVQSKYSCKYCGKNDSTISSLTSSFCRNSPHGKHQPIEDY